MRAKLVASSSWRALETALVERPLPRTSTLALEGMVEHIAALEIAGVGRLLEHDVFGEVLRVVAHVQAGDVDR